MERIKQFVVAFAVLVAGIASVQPQQAHATTMLATVCTIAFNPCPAGDILDQGIRTNGVNTLAANRYAVLPFVFVDAASSVTGDVVVADVAGKYIYLVGFGAATSTVGPIDIDIAISQTYRTLSGKWTFSGFNIGSCNAAATADGDGVTSLPYVNGVKLGAPVSSPCSPFAQGFGPKQQLVGPYTTLTAAAIFGFNGGGAQLITLPWGDDFPDPDLSNLNVDSTTTLSSYESALQSDGLSMGGPVPEPAIWAIMLVGIFGMGAAMRGRRGKELAAITAA
jgi:hypothetical protein